MSKESGLAVSAAAYCEDCDVVFDHEARDVFAGEVFCPECAGRALERFQTMTKAKRAHKAARVYREPRAALRS